MATKKFYYCLPDKLGTLYGEPSNEQYSNLNLNHNNQSLQADNAHLKNTPNNSRKVQNYGRIL